MFFRIPTTPFGQGPKYFGLVQIVLNMTVQFIKKSVARAKNNFGSMEEQGFRTYQKKRQVLKVSKF